MKAKLRQLLQQQVARSAAASCTARVADGKGCQSGKMKDESWKLRQPLQQWVARSAAVSCTARVADGKGCQR